MVRGRHPDQYEHSGGSQGRRTELRMETDCAGPPGTVAMWKIADRRRHVVYFDGRYLRSIPHSGNPGPNVEAGIEVTVKWL